MSHRYKHLLSPLLFANFFIKKSFAYDLPICHEKVLYLLFLFHGWCMAICDDIDTGIRREYICEAWKRGPMYPYIYCYCLAGYRDCNIIVSNLYEEEMEDIDLTSDLQELNLSNKEKLLDVLDFVWDTYKDFSIDSLRSLLTCPGSPWDQCVIDGKYGKRIPASLVKQYYTNELERLKTLNDT